ncbi:MAG: gliding motility-associated C-terminal domain-containing protein [Saprospiraceae bacterium]|nr:gliding motility-associated C-terminal domain-containing protein [Saprospiraceae bacterium]
MQRQFYNLYINLLFILCICGVLPSLYSQCTGLDADAGQDITICDLSEIIQLNGSVQGTYTSFKWTPSTHLTSPDVLDPFVTTRVPGKYTYKLTAEGVSTNNLITNGNFESGNSGFSSGYTFNFVNTTEGEYFVTSNPSSWNGGFSPCGDNTSGAGNMLLVNGHPVAGTNFWCQTIPTVIGRMYLFEFYHTSVVSSNPGQLAVKINGSTVGGVTAGSLCNWERYEICFTATTASTQICLSESSGIRGGNDFAIDDIALFEKCMDMDEVTVEIIDLQAKITILKAPKCSSEPFDLTALGSSFGPNIRYEWSTDGGRIISKNGPDAKVRGSGFYTLKVIYTNGSVSCEKEVTIEFNAPDELAGSLIPDKKINCNKDSVTIQVQMNSGSGDYSYVWSPESALLSGQNTESVVVNQIRTYMVTITDVNTGCVLVLDVNVSADTLRPMVQIMGDSLLDCRKTTINLRGLTNDSLKTNLNWILPDQSVILNSKTILSSLQGIYTLIITDTVNQCKDSAFWKVGLDTITPSLELGNDLTIDCKNNQIIIKNETPNLNGRFSYYWQIDTLKLPTDSIESSKNISKASKVFLRIVNEENACETYDSVEIFDFRILPFIDAGLDSILNCDRRSIMLEANFSLADSLGFIWTTIGGNISNGQNTATPTVNQKGWYFVKVTNKTNGCENIDSLFIDEDLILPQVVLGPEMFFACKDSFLIIDASASSTGSSFKYIWSTANGIISSGQGSQIIEAGAPGLYQLHILNEKNGCEDSSSILLKPDLNKPIIQIVIPDTLNCKNKNVDLIANANSMTGNPLSAIWSGPIGSMITNPDSLNTRVNIPGIYTLKVTDNLNGCSSLSTVNVSLDTIAPTVVLGMDKIWNCASSQFFLEGNISNDSSHLSFRWSTIGGAIRGNANQRVIEANAVGDYVLLVEDLRNGCVAMDTLKIIADFNKPILNIEIPDTLDCKVIEATIVSNVSGSSGMYIYTWSTSNGNISSGINSPDLIVSGPGLYRLVVIDQNNLCSNEATVAVIENKAIPNFQIQKPLELNCSSQISLLSATLNNLNSNFMAFWSTSTGRLIGKPDSLQVEADLPGRYYLRILNTQNGCERIDSVDVIENFNVPTDIIFDLLKAKCQGDPAAISILQIEGGTGPFTYWLDNQKIQTLYFSGLIPGWHQLRIEDANGCILTKDFEIQEPSPIDVSLPPLVKINEAENLTLKPVFSIPTDSILWISWTPSEFLSCSDCPEPELVGIKSERSYTVSYSNRQGCIASASILIQIIKRGVWIPDAFSPNGDVVNDWFFPVVTEDSYTQVKSFSIYDRWGALVFNNYNFLPNVPDEGWDGRFRNVDIVPGVYVYILELEWKNGETQILQGDVTLIR